MTPFTLFYNSPLELIILTSVIVAAFVIAWVVYRTDTTSATNQLFALLTLFTLLWLVITYIVRIPAFAPQTLLLHRLGIFFAAPMSYLFFLFGHTVPERRLRFSRSAQITTVAATVAMMTLNLSPYAFTGEDTTGQPQVGPGLLPFAVLSTAYSVLAIYFLIQRYRHATAEVKNQIGLVLVGIAILLSFITLTILVPVVFFHSLQFLPFTPLYVLAFLALTAYAITEYHLFNIKVLLTQALTAVIEIVLFAKIAGEYSTNARILDGTALLFMLVFGYFLVQSVKKEVRQRELIETQEKELEGNNARLQELDQQKTEFLSFASHQLRTPLTSIKWSSGALSDGSYGEVPEHLRQPIQTIFEESKAMAAMIDDYLNVSRIELGRIQYQFEPIDLAGVLRAVVAELEPTVHQKGLELKAELPAERVMVWGDANKLTQVFGNIVDNAMKYTEQGCITLTLTRKNQTARVAIQDTGIGIAPEMLDRVFHKFTRGENATKVNGGGSGLGLFIVKNFIEAHKGKIWPESAGVGKGTTFNIELPVLVASGSVLPTTQEAPLAA